VATPKIRFYTYRGPFSNIIPVNVFEIINADLCSYCGSCTAVCPTKAVNYIFEEPDHPVITEDACIYCSLCSMVCPHVAMKKEMFIEPPVPKEKYLARTKIEALGKVAQDGGVTSSLIIAALEEGLIDAAFLVARDEYWRPVPIIAKTKEDVIKAAGSKYVYSPVNHLLETLAYTHPELNRVLTVGLPCQIRAIQRAREVGLRKFVSKIAYTISIMCSENWQWSKMLEMMKSAGVKPEEVVKKNIKAKFFFYLKDGRTVEYSLKDAAKFLIPACRHCPEFLSYYSDITVGALGLIGWNAVLIMNDKGEELWKATVERGYVEYQPLPEDRWTKIVKFDKRKKRNALKFIAAFYGLTEEVEAIKALKKKVAEAKKEAK